MQGYSKQLKKDTLERDAALVHELHNKPNKERFEQALKWFIQKHQCDYRQHVKEEVISR